MASEIKPEEYRVALTPAGALELVQRGHEVLVETGAGDGSAFHDAAYTAVGARIVSLDEVWDEAELLLKVKEPMPRPSTTASGRPRAVHLPPSRGRRAELTRALVDRRRRRRLRDRRDRTAARCRCSHR